MMPIVPLPQFEADLAEYTEEQDRLARERLTPPKTVVCRFGSKKLIGEFRYRLDDTPGCGSKLIVHTFRGIEMGEMLTSTCPNSGCGKSISRQEMLEYIDASGGRDFPFYDKGRVLRVATHEDLDAHAECEQAAHGLKLRARSVAEDLGLTIRIVQAERILGGETLSYYYLAEQQDAVLPGQPKPEQKRGPDPRLQAGKLRDALQKEAPEGTRVEIRPVGARDEARLTADYERCGQHCCCKNFLKVLKPVPMRAAKQQKATLDPLKISGRCGRLMCCLRYEDESYRELAARLPNRKPTVGTPEGVGLVLDTQILTQLVLVKLDFDGREVAVPVEELMDPSDAPDPGAIAAKERAEAREQAKARETAGHVGTTTTKKKRRRKKKPSTAEPQALEPQAGEAAPAKKKKRRRKKKPQSDATSGAPQDRAASDRPSDDVAPKKKKRRRRRKPRGEGGSPPSEPSA